MPPEHQHLVQIRDLIHKHFNLEEFRDLCFELGIYYDDLPGEGLPARVRELVTQCDRTGRSIQLLTRCIEHRSHIKWLNWVWEKDGKVMVYVPAGEFLYGNDKRKIHLDGFWIDKTPVTNAEYKRFLDANPKHRVPFANFDWAKPYNWDEKKRTHPADKANHPVVLVSWDDAQAYAIWAGKRLPTEQEWEKAARGTDGREYPWGTWRDGCANTEEARIGGTSAAGQFSPQGDSPYGCVDMAGNVWEWTDSWWDEEQKSRGLCGGSWDFGQRDARVSARLDSRPHDRSDLIGFRCVATVVSGS